MHASNFGESPCLSSSPPKPHLTPKANAGLIILNHSLSWSNHHCFKLRSPSCIHLCHNRVAQRDTLSTRGLGCKVGLRRKGAAIAGFLAAASIYSTLVFQNLLREEAGIKIPAGRDPQEQVAPVTLAFSLAARSQVQPPAGRAPVRHDVSLPSIKTNRQQLSESPSRKNRLSKVKVGMDNSRQEQRAPATAFSVLALSQLQLRALCLPQEHLA